MNKAYHVANSYEKCSEVIDMINNNCKVDNESLIPMKFYIDGLFFWCIECLNQADEKRLEKHLNYIFGLEAN